MNIYDNVYGLDVEIVRVEPNYKRSAAQVTIVGIVDNYYHKIYDKYVRQEAKVLRYYTKRNGITKETLKGGKLLKNVRADVLFKLGEKKHSTLVGHDLYNDLKLLNITNSDLEDINCYYRNTTDYSKFRSIRPDKTIPSLKQLAQVFLRRDIQDGRHSTVEDALACLDLYIKNRPDWEIEIMNQEESETEESETEESDYGEDSYSDQ